MLRDLSSRANLRIIYTVEQLKCWLKCRRLKQAGKREDMLGAHVNDCLKSGNHHILDPGIDNGKWLEVNILRNRKPESLEASIKTVHDVPLIPKTGWKAFPSQDLPSLFNYGHVYHYVYQCRAQMYVFMVIIKSTAKFSPQQVLIQH